MELPPSIADPIFMCELALELGMPVGELGQRMSNHELCVVWPLFFDYRRREADRDAENRRRR
jgi:hypothetical protein